MISSELLALREARYAAQRAFNHTHGAFWNDTPDAPTLHACAAAAAQLNVALTALLSYLRTDPQHAAEQARAEQLQVTLQRENALMQERARQAGLMRNKG